MKSQTKMLLKNIKAYALGICWGFPKPSGIMVDCDGNPLKFKSLVVSYQKTGRPEDDKIKVWNVAVKTVEPDETFKTHTGWMLHILLELVYTQSVIADLENIELRQLVNAYKAIGKIDRSCISNKVLESHEPNKTNFKK